MSPPTFTRAVLRTHILAALGVAGCTGVPTPHKPSGQQPYDRVDRDGDGVPAGEDCNDSDPSIFPDADEACNLVDDDCDGEIDEEVRLVYYRDADGDTFGNPSDLLAACEQPEGYVVNDEDCNDASADAFPGGEEVCDGLDNDCDGSTDDIPGFWPDLDGDGFGGTGEAATLCAPMPDGYADNQADCDDSNDRIHPDEPEHCFDGTDNNCDGLLSCVTVEVQEEGSESWCSVTWAIEDAQASTWDSYPCEGCDYTFNANLEVAEILGDSDRCADAGDISTLLSVQGTVVGGALNAFSSDSWYGDGAFYDGILTWYDDPARVAMDGGGYLSLTYGGELQTYEVASYYYGYYGYYEGRPLSVGGAHVVATEVARGDWSRPEAVIGAHGLSGAERERAVAAWTRAGLAEHASVASFSRFAMELMSLGAPPSLLMESLQAAQDEVLHARDCFTVASALAGRPIGPGSLPVTGVFDDASLEGIFTRLLSEGCVEETVSTALAALRLRHATDPLVRATLERIVSDETRHAALAWRTARWILSQHPHLQPLARSVLHEAMGRATQPEGEGVSPALRSVGVLARAEQARERERTLREVVAPAVDALLAGGGATAESVRA